MEPRIRFTLVANAIERLGVGTDPFIEVDVQVWRDDTHVETIKIVDMLSVKLPASVNDMSAENWASALTRTIARIVSDAQMNAVQDSKLHQRNDYVS